MANTPLFRYGVAVAAVAVAVLVRWLLDPLMGDTLPLVTVFGAVAAAVWLGGYRPALIATALGYLACDYLFIDPRGSLGLDSARNVVGLVAYLVTCSVIIGFGEAMRVARRREAEQKERLRTTLASIGDAVITTDLTGHVTNMNAVAEALTGWANADAVGQPLDAVFNIVNEETRKTVENPATRALREGVIVGLANHTILISRDGTERPIDDSAAPIRRKEGEVVGCVLVFRDITERKRADDRQRESEGRLRQLADAMPQIVYVAEADGPITFINRQWHDYTGQPNAQTADLGPLVHPDDLPPMLRQWEQAKAGGSPFQAEFRLRRAADGVYRWFLTRAVPVRDDGGRIVQWYGTSTDIHDQKRAEERFRLAADAVNGIVYEYDFATGHVERQRGLYEVLGYRPDEVPPTAAWWAEQIHPEDVERVKNIDSQAVTGGATLTEYRVRHKDGRWLHVEDRAMIVRGGDDQPVKLVGCTTDVTARTEAEMRVRQGAEELRTLLDTLPVGVFFAHDPDCRRITGNPRANASNSQ